MADSLTGTRSLVVRHRGEPALQFTRLTLQIVAGPDAGRVHHDEGDAVFVGSGPGCQLVLTDLTVSRRHLCIRLHTEGIQIEDLGSKNGTWIQGARVDRATVVDGTTVRVGVTSLRVERTAEILDLNVDPSREFHGLVSRNPVMQGVFSLLDRMARNDLTVMILGETGTGKENLARGLHLGGERRERPLQILDCGSMSPELLASDLFGHERGAFTGASERRLGVFELAPGGTVVLDEVGEIPLSLQPALLRVLETRQLTRLGSRNLVTVDFRVVSSTNRDLRQMVAQGKFRADLFFRLAGVIVRVPPLRERPEDVALLAGMYLEQFARAANRPTPRLPPPVLEKLRAYEWPGNVRELRNLMAAACALESDSEIPEEWVDQSLAADPRVMVPGDPVPQSDGTLQAPAPQADSTRGRSGPSLRDSESRLIEETLVACGWNIRDAAKRLGIGRNTLYQKMARAGLKRPGPAES